MKQNNHELSHIAHEFNLGEIKDITNLEDGIVNTSYKIATPKGIFILQKLSPIFNEKVIEDYQNVQSYLRTYGLQVPVLLSAKDSKPYFKNENLWRTFEYIPNDQIFEGDKLSEKSENIVYEAGKALGKFHRIMKNSTFKPQFKLEGFHDTIGTINKLHKLYTKKNNPDKSNKVKEEYEFITNRIKQHYLPENFPTTTIHGDPNIGNFLFKDNKAIAILDLDTMMESNELIDLGDALRSWCKDKKGYNQCLFDSSIAGYLSENPVKYEESMLMKATGLITLELAARFLNDYFEENYFVWDKTKYNTSAEHNLQRCKNSINYYQQFSKEFVKRRYF
ncbi:MAG: phosphotransferase [Candidatus Pacearchaeota archaeon]